METPKTLQQAIIHFSKPENCNAFMIAARFADGKPRCPQCDPTTRWEIVRKDLYCHMYKPRMKLKGSIG
jgi:hypothetical protein